MSSEVNKIRAKFETSQADAVDTRSAKKVQQHTSKVRGKKPPPPAKNPHLASKAIRDKLNAAIAQDSTHKPSPPPKRYPVNSKKDSTDELSSSPGLSALANVLQHSPKSQHGSSNGVKIHEVPSLSPPLKPRNEKGSPVLRATGKAHSADLSEPRTSADVPRPHSSMAGSIERGGVGAGNGTVSSNNTTKHQVQGVNIPSSPPLSNSCGHLNSVVEESDRGVVKQDRLSSKDWLEKSASLPRNTRSKVERSKPASPPVKVKSTSSIVASVGEKSPTHSRRPPPVPPAQKRPPTKQKPPVSTKPKPLPPPKPLLLTNLREDARFSQRRSSSPASGSSRENTPDRDIETKKRSVTVTSEEEKAVANSLNETLKAPLTTSKSAEDSWVLISESQIDDIMNSPHHQSQATPTDKKRPPPTPPRVKSPGISSSPSSSSGRRSETPQSAGVDGPKETFTATPQSPTSPTNVAEIKDEITSPNPPSPTITIIRSHSDGASSKSPKRPVKQSSLHCSGVGRGNIDSGFSDDVALGRETSVENTPSEAAPETPLSPEVWDEARLEKARTKRRNIAQELLDTEKTYVDRLRMIAVNFYEAVQQYNQKKQIPESAIFLNIRQIHTLNENILQEIQTRMENWETHEALGDVLCRLAPFLKLYALYTSGFEDAMKTFTEWSKKDRKFDTVVKEFERDTISTGLGVAHYMLEPVQRIPRYRLLLADYLKYLPPDSPDRPDTEKALKLISEAADRTNNRIKELENSNEILSIQRSITDFDQTLLIPSRIFLKKGPLQKFSRKTLTPRMFFLFSDFLLHTQPSGTDIYKLRNEMPIFGMQVEEPVVSLVAHSFNVHSTTRSLILVANSEEEKLEWIQAIRSAINDDAVKRSSLRREVVEEPDSDTQVFGFKAPIMVPDKSVTMCQKCSAEFTFTFRRHHCRACGKVVCGNCSQWKAFLTYCNKIDRVCAVCFERSAESKAKGAGAAEASNLAIPSPKLNRHHSLSTGVLHLKGLDENAVMAGYVLSQDGRKWNRMWYQIKRDFVLYKFRAHEDIKAINSMPLPGYRVSPDRGNYTIHLIHPSSSKKNLSDTFKVDDPVAFENWASILERAVQMDLPSPSSTPLANQTSFERSNEHSRPVSTLSSEGSHPDSFDTYDDSDSRPSSFREASPEVTVSFEKSI